MSSDAIPKTLYPARCSASSRSAGPMERIRSTTLTRQGSGESFRIVLPGPEETQSRRPSRKAEATSPSPIRRSIGKDRVGMLLGAIPPSGVAVAGVLFASTSGVGIRTRVAGLA